MLTAIARSYQRHVLRDTYRLYVTGLIVVAVMCIAVITAPGRFLDTYGDMTLIEQFNSPAPCFHYTADCEKGYAVQ